MGRVDPLAALIMLMGASVGAEIGAMAAVSAGSHKIRLYLALLHIGAAASVGVKQAGVYWGLSVLESASLYLLLAVATSMAALILVPYMRQRWQSLRGGGNPHTLRGPP